MLFIRQEICEITVQDILKFLLSIRSEEHTSELQSRLHLVCRLLLEKKKKKNNNIIQRKINKAQCCKPMIARKLYNRINWSVTLASDTNVQSAIRVVSICIYMFLNAL